jgi:hypothetical protein
MTQSATTLEHRLFQGDQAKIVLENEAFQAAFSAVEKEVTEQWQNSPARDRDGRESLWQYLMMLRKVKAHLQTTLETGTLAKLELQHQQTLADRARGWLSRVA